MTTEREIVSSRTINAPRDLVFKAWSDPKILASWWGPDGFSNTFHEFNFVIGGNWNFIMHGPDGTDYPNNCVFENIVSPELIVFTHLEPVHQFRATVTFDETGNSTRLIFNMLFDSAEECTRIKPYVRIANEQNFDRLEEAVLNYLSKKNTTII